MARDGINRYNVLITGGNIIPADDTDKTKFELVSELKLLNNAAYNELIIIQEDKVCSQILKEAKIERMMGMEMQDKRG